MPARHRFADVIMCRRLMELNLIPLIIRHYGLYDCEAERLFSEKVVSKFGGFAKAPYICTVISSGCANSGAHKRDKAI